MSPATKSADPHHLPLWLVLACGVLVLVGCATRTSVLAPYADVPATCEAIDAEMCRLARWDARVFSSRVVKEGAAAGVAAAAAAGVLPAGWAWAPLVASLARSVMLPTHDTRLEHLAVHRALRGCPSNIACKE